jgi:aminomethyltransferase|tara:strand:- start:6090 stop:7166 length:1077 start_codon:yes stop_codon:yes gene_type:complete
MMKKLSLSHTHESLNAKMVDYAGFYMPVQYEGVIAEHLSVRNNVGVFDVSHMGEIFINGEGAKDFLQFITSNDINKLVKGKVQYSCLPNLDGGIVDDILVYMLSNNSFMLVVNASNINKDLAWLNTHNSYNCTINNKSDLYSLLAVQGPKSLDLLKELTNTDIQQLKYYTFLTGNISGINNVIISRTGYTGELGFELYVLNESVLDLWDSLFKTKINITPIGLAARNTLRLEKGFCLYGNDINDQTSPLEAGLGWITKLSTNFINSQNLLKQKDDGLEKKLVGFEVLDKGIARKDYRVFDNDKNMIGIVTSGTMSPSLNKAIGMAYVDVLFSNINQDILIEVRNKFILAKIILLPFVD